MRARRHKQTSLFYGSVCSGMRKSPIGSPCLYYFVSMVTGHWYTKQRWSPRTKWLRQVILHLIKHYPFLVRAGKKEWQINKAQFMFHVFSLYHLFVQNNESESRFLSNGYTHVCECISTNQHHGYKQGSESWSQACLICGPLKWSKDRGGEWKRELIVNGDSIEPPVFYTRLERLVLFLSQRRNRLPVER